MLEFGESEGFQERLDVDAETVAEAIFQFVPAADGVIGGAAPGFDGAVLGRFWFVGAAAVGEAASVVEQDGFADGAGEDFDAILFVGVHGGLGVAGRGLEG